MKKFLVFAEPGDPNKVGITGEFEAETAARAIEKALDKWKIDPSQVASGEYSTGYDELTDQD